MGQVALLERLRAERLRAVGIIIQSWVRGWLGHRTCIKTHLGNTHHPETHRRSPGQAVVAERAAVRGWLARQAYRRVRADMVLMQRCVRRRAATRELVKLKAEDRSVEKFRELNKGMAVKRTQLQLRADQEIRDSSALRETLQAEHKAHSSELDTCGGR
ncbi:unconventional myosin-Va [Oncorhynchus mykiss]|uniref:unconventional myosin-Va n=1 Tax=Oncorhynchus mykiss TaxID=8022 RepID=UPI00187845E0|nr:unconventional myosin-Va [Oncorhynchus mykiss]XP_036825079.1 unconventional myosin-Va [Oncorhynchus mykiss]